MLVNSFLFSGCTDFKDILRIRRIPSELLPKTLIYITLITCRIRCNIVYTNSYDDDYDSACTIPLLGTALFLHVGKGSERYIKTMLLLSGLTVYFLI